MALTKEHMNANIYQPSIKLLNKRFDNQTTSNLDRNAVPWPETGPKQATTNAVLRRSCRCWGRAIEKLTERGIFRRAQIHTLGASPVGFVLRRNWIFLALLAAGARHLRELGNRNCSVRRQFSGQRCELNNWTSG